MAFPAEKYKKSLFFYTNSLVRFQFLQYHISNKIRLAKSGHMEDFMKLMKKALVAVSVLALASVIFAGCKKEDDDDENNMISGSNNNYSIAYKNETSSVSRGYQTTTFKHLGALCQMTMKVTSSAPDGAMGYIWDLESNSTRAVKEPRRFFIVGFNYNDTATGKVAYYVSRYTNVTDIMEENFGTKLTSNPAVEKEYIKLNSTNVFTPTQDSSGNIVVTVNVYEGTYDADAADGTSYKKGDYNGTFVVDIYNGAVAKADLATATKADSVTIPAADIGYLSAGTSKSARQKNGAVYANVYAGKTLTGSWKYLDTYSEAEVIEE